MGSVIALDLAWIATPFVSLSGNSWWVLALMLAFATSLMGAAHLGRLSPNLYTAISGLSIALVLWPFLKILNYITMSFPMPLADKKLAAWDTILGFDWLSYIQWLDQYPEVISLMGMAYGSLIHYCCIAFLIILAVKGHERAADFICLFVISAVFTILVGPIFPAQGAMTFFAPDQSQFEFVNPAMGTYFWPPLAEIRGASQLHLTLTDLPGLVAFPSFHTAMGVILIYVSRGAASLLVPSLAFNTLMIASTPLFGGHYLVDIIAGFATAFGTILLYKRSGIRARVL